MGLRALIGANLIAAAALLMAATPIRATAEPMADGLIVRLKVDARRSASSAATHVDTQSQALALESDSRTRLSAVLRGSSASLGDATIIQPVGRAAHLVRWPSAPSPSQLQAYAQALAQQPDVESVEVDTMEPRLAASVAPNIPSDPLYARQTWLQAATTTAAAGLPDMPNAWLRSTGSPVSTYPWIAVAVLDTGMLADHPDLMGRWLPGYDFITRAVYANDGDGRDADPSDPGDWVTAADAAPGGILAGCTVEDSSWHGTLIAGQIAASTNNNVGVAGINWATRIVPVRVGGRCGAQLSDIIDAMRWAAGLTVIGANGQAMAANANPVRVINISFGGSGACSAALQDAVNELRAQGVVVVAAAGNTGGAVSRPANCSGVIGVGALNARGFKTPYSSFGTELSISTVGGDDDGTDACSLAVADQGILSTHDSAPQGPSTGTYNYASMDGTSFSAPIVTGTISLMLALNPTLSVDQIVAGLKASARPHVLAGRLGACSTSNAGRCACTTATCGAGILDAPRALAFAADPVNWTATPLTAVSIDDATLSACGTNGSTSPGGLTAVPSATSGTTTAASNGSGGGSVDVSWLALLATATVMMARARRRPSGSNA